MAQQTTDGCKTLPQVTTSQIDPDHVDCRRPSIKDRVSSICANTGISRNQWLCCVNAVLACITNSMLVAPDKRLLESAVCRKYYDRHFPGYFPPNTLIPELQCKESDIQSTFASITSIMLMEQTAIDLLVSVPLGRLADRKGFKLLLIANIVFSGCYWAYVLVVGRYSHVLPLWLYYLAPLVYAPAGTPVVGNTLILAVISKAVPSSKRTAAFSTYYGFSWAALLVGPVLGSTVMSTNLALPFLIGIGLTALQCVPIAFLQSSKAVDQQAASISVSTNVSDDPMQPLLREGLRQDEVCKDEPELLNKPQGSWFKFVKGLVSQSDKTIIFGVVTQVLLGIAVSAKAFLLPYVSLRFSWTMAEAGYLQTLTAALSLLAYMFLLPIATSWMSRKWEMTQLHRDIRITQFSTVLLGIGCFFIGTAPYPVIMVIGVAINSLGAGADCVLRAALSALVDGEQAGQLFVTLGLFDTMAVLAGVPLMASAYSWSSDKPRSLSGLPFLISSGVLLLALIAMLGMKTRRR